MRKLKKPTVFLALLFVLSIGVNATLASELTVPETPSVVDVTGDVVFVADDQGEQGEQYGDPDDAITGNRGPTGFGSTSWIDVDDEEDWMEYFMAWVQGLIFIP